MFAPDPGGVFASDTHRRVLGHVPDAGDEPLGLHPLGHRISPDSHHGLQHVDDLAKVLSDLVAEGYCSEGEDGWVCTEEGMDALCRPAPEQEGAATPAVIGGLDQGGLG